MNRNMMLLFKSITSILCLLVMLTSSIIFIKNQKHYPIFINDSIPPQFMKTYFEPDRPKAGSIEEIYLDGFLLLLLPYIQQSVNDYYKENVGYLPTVDPWDIDVLSIERPNGYRTFLFLLKLQLTPYLGAHNTIGLDHITIRVALCDVKVEKFEHIESYPIPPWLQ